MMEINEMWNESTSEAKDFYQKIETQTKEMDSNSKGIIKKLMDSSRKEIVWGMIISLILSYCYSFNYPAIILVFASLVTSCAITFTRYRRLKQNIFSINTHNTVKSLKLYIQILKDYVAKFRMSVFIFVPTVFYLSVFLTFYNKYLLEGFLDFTKALIAIGISTPFLLGFLFWEFRAYVKRKYLNQIESLEEQLESLEN